jgi:hypothetical protein
MSPPDPSGSAVRTTGADTQAPSFVEIWQAAVGRYEQTTGRSLLYTGPNGHFYYSRSVNDVIRVLRRKGKAAKAFRAEGEKIQAVLAPLVRIVLSAIDHSAEVRISAEFVCIEHILYRYHS